MGCSKAGIPFYAAGQIIGCQVWLGSRRSRSYLRAQYYSWREGGIARGETGKVSVA
jgi:hypothetical protein